MQEDSLLRYLTTASWLSGYADSLEQYQQGKETLIHKLRYAAQLLEAVYQKENNGL